ncbi:hypothetical protein ASF61_06945 [Duganella sp. Leaf126]|uniref:hypothetical protein n=1 Tax=Duganella sp. Leaf126 TaxID=1736266 RepID=UPI0006FEF4AE|nr:hypothetical protein [Duganella sp. Leaf126]KQQ40483.1 hypothetical protein ASF61_06945 [Duganella sp. Leaf126]
MSAVTNMFGRINAAGNVNVLHIEDGSAITRMKDIDAWPVGSSLSVDWEHPEGIELTIEDAERIGLIIEK